MIERGYTHVWLADVDAIGSMLNSGCESRKFAYYGNFHYNFQRSNAKERIKMSEDLLAPTELEHSSDISEQTKNDFEIKENSYNGTLTKNIALQNNHYSLEYINMAYNSEDGKFHTSVNFSGTDESQVDFNAGLYKIGINYATGVDIGEKPEIEKFSNDKTNVSFSYDNADPKVILEDLRSRGIITSPQYDAATELAEELHKYKMSILGADQQELVNNTTSPKIIP